MYREDNTKFEGASKIVKKEHSNRLPTTITLPISTEDTEQLDISTLETWLLDAAT